MTSLAEQDPLRRNDLPSPLLLPTLRNLPTVIRYYDDFTNKYKSIRDLDVSSVWGYSVDGLNHNINFSRFDRHYDGLLKAYVVSLFQDLDPSTVITHINGLISLNKILSNPIGNALSMNPSAFKLYWNANVIAACTSHDIATFKSLLRFMCSEHISDWSVDYIDYIGSLPTPKVDQYRIIREGECFIPVLDQARIVEHIQNATIALSEEPRIIEGSSLQSTCILALAHQWGLRPGQMARIRFSDVNQYATGAVHLTVRRTKKRSKHESFREKRKLKREWAPLFLELLSMRRSGRIKTSGVHVPDDCLFGLAPNELSIALSALTEEVAGSRWTPTDLRHTGAQRLADAGANQIEIAEYLGHSHVHTAFRYIQGTPTQAQLANDSLALSQIYVSLSEIARTKTIDKVKLEGLEPEHQVGGMPHGVPISGIGACEVGQSLCAKTPAVSCYSCIHFMAIRDASVHRQVADDLRPIVLQFEEASRGERVSPAYMQLRSALSAAETAADLIDSARGPSDE